ncbi:KAP family P-loop domain protein [Nocardioides aquiterrae]|uniref:KAP family P-loop domain protein n=1 Tax=Nocardioides aquiterrae TaxID=203799 RepID=A0ABP4EZP0_9ACTN
MSEGPNPLWSDEPAGRDLLSFLAVAETVTDAVLDDSLDPVALGLSGSWGAGKTTVLELVKQEVQRRAEAESTKVLVVATQPWSYDPTVGPKESLIAEVLDALKGQIDTSVGVEAQNLLLKLTKRVKWAKALKMAALTSITLQLPKVEDVLDLINEDPVEGETEPTERGLAQFRDEFEELLKSDGLKHISRVVVLVDDLDRCLPETVVETLEAIRLFLSAKGMSFVIAADEDRVADAIQKRLGSSSDERGAGESPAELYLHKIVQTTIPIPALSQFDTQAYLFLLLAEAKLTAEAFEALVASTADLRMQAGSLDDLALPADVDLAEERATASRLTPLLYEKFRGNPRRIKRFLNDLHVRQSVASRRGISLASDAVAKLMMLERLLDDDFKTVLDWLAQTKLRDQMDALDRAANEAVPVEPTEPAVEADQTAPKKKATAKPPAPAAPASEEAPFSDSLIRWAKLPPKLDASDISGYLYLAASFAGIELVSSALPERLRDIASALMSSLQVDRNAVTDEALQAVKPADARLLIAFLGSSTRDQPSIQKFSVPGILRVSKTHPGIEDAAVSALKLLPPSEVKVATVMLLKPEAEATFEPVLGVWDVGSASRPVREVITKVRQAWGTPDGN